MDDERQLLEVGIAEAQLKATKRRLASGEKLERIHQEEISHVDDRVFITLAILLAIVATIYIFFDARTLITECILLILSGLLIRRFIVKLKKRTAQINKRKQDLKDYS